METHLDGEYVRFHGIGAGLNDDPLVFYTELGTVRSLDSSETFYLCSLGWVDGTGMVGSIYDDVDAGDDLDAASETVWVFNLKQGFISFDRPIPIHKPRFEIGTESSGQVWGHGFIRSA